MSASDPWYAAAAGLVLMAASHTAWADPNLGRLFNTPAERVALDANRGKAVAAVNATPAAAPSPSDFLPPGVPGNMGAPAPQGQMPYNAALATLAAGADAPATPPPPEQLELNGVVRSSSGRSTVWLNNMPQSGPQNKFSNRNKKALTVTLPSGKKVLLQPGQRYDLADGRVKDINEP